MSAQDPRLIAIERAMREVIDPPGGGNVRKGAPAQVRRSYDTLMASVEQSEAGILAPAARGSAPI